MNSLPSTDAMMAVLEAARTGSMAAAADRLGVTHGAISRRIQAAEFWLGSPIFERRGRGVRLTAQGSQFVRRTERALGSIDALRSELSTARTPALRISVLPSVARLWLLPRLEALEAALPAHRIIDVEADHRVARLDAREADVAIRFGHGAWPEAAATLLFGERIQPVAARDVAARLKGRPVSALLSETLIHDSDGAEWRQWFRLAGEPWAPAGPERRFLDHDLALQCARRGLGVALARLPLAASALEDGGLVPLDHPAFPADRGHYVVLRPKENRRVVQALVDALIGMGGEPRS